MAGILTLPLYYLSLFFGFSFLLHELKKRKGLLKDVTFESIDLENGGFQVAGALPRVYVSLQDVCNLIPGTPFCDQASLEAI